MRQNQHANYFLLICLIASFIVMYFIIQPFMAPLILAGLFAFLFQPIYQRFLRLAGGRMGVSALATTSVAVVLVVIPLAFLGFQIFKESTDLFHALTSGRRNEFSGMAETAAYQLLDMLPISANFEINFGEYARQAVEYLVQNLGAIFSSLAKLFLNIFVFLVAFYFFLKDGKRLKDYFVALSPLSDKNDALIISSLESAVSATVKGSLTIGLIQGALTGIGFALFGVPHPALWGCVAAIAATLPGFGTALVIVPAILFLFFLGGTGAALGLTAWGAIAVGLVDNFLGPRLIGHRMQLHPLAVFLAILGGLAFFGPLGFLLGPLAMSVCLALVEIYFSLRKEGA